MDRKGASLIVVWIAVCAAIAMLSALILVIRNKKAPGIHRLQAETVDLRKSARKMPAHFPVDTHLPPCRETRASGALNPDAFSPEENLIRIDDERVWWESEHVKNGDEDDHIIHQAMKAPLHRLIKLVCQRGRTLKVQDAYRPKGGHCPTSLHKEGRAIDLTCDDLSLETLAKLCWVAGFDWVYYEAEGGEHIHCSVRAAAGRDPQSASPITDNKKAEKRD